MCALLHVSACACINTYSCAYLHVRFDECVNCELGRRDTTPVWCPVNPPLPSFTAIATIPLIPSKNRKAGTVFAVGYEMASSCGSPYTVHDVPCAALCWRKPAVLSLCVPWSHSVLSFNPLLTKQVCMRQRCAHVGEHTHTHTHMQTNTQTE